MELMVVLIIVGILAILALPQFRTAREKALDKEAQANLKIIQAAEKIYRMEATFYPTDAYTPDTAAVNSMLLLDIPPTANWAYSVDSTVLPFRGKAVRSIDGRIWCIRKDDLEPSDTSQAWCN